jgi:hypothetical protein
MSANRSKGVGAIDVSNKLASSFNEREQIPSDLIGSKIISFGAPIGAVFEGGGLIVDYINNNGESKRICLEFNELGMWTVKSF